jgi:putative DNA primase/helicase
MGLFEQHAKMLAASMISPEHARARPYRSVDTKKRLEDLGITPAGRNVPGLLVPLLSKDGSTWGYQYRPDSPRLRKNGGEVKYETPTDQHNHIDVPPGVGPRLDDPTIPLWITEGSKKADAAACAGLVCVALLGVWNWRGTNDLGGKIAIADFHDIALNGRDVVLAFDSDVVRKREVRGALAQLAGYLKTKGSSVRYLHLPDDQPRKTGLDDYLANHTVEELWTLVRPDLPILDQQPQHVQPPSEWRPSVYSQTDDGNALHLIDDYGRTLRRVADMRRWFAWDGCRWAQDQEGRAVREAARDLARELPSESQEQRSFKRNSMSATGISGAVRVAETDRRVSILAAELDAHPELINTPTGIVNLRTGEITAHDPQLLLTRITEYSVDLGAPHPRWDAFLAETFPPAEDGTPNELIGYMQRLYGLALVGTVREHVLPFHHGVGANGKGVITLVLQGLLGDADSGGYAVSAPDGFLMAGRDSVHPTEIARLRGARLVVCSEQTSGKRFDESKVKRLTGGDLLTGRFMRGDFFDFPPSHLIWVLSNHLPAVREGGPAFWRRVRRIPFTHVVPEERRVADLHEQLLAVEGPAILGWAVRGAVDVLANGLQDPAAVIKATEDYQVSEDTLASFVRDECLLAPDWWCTVPDFRAAYEKHCEEMGVGVTDRLSARGLGMRLTAEYPVRGSRLSKGRVRTYVGIALQSTDDPGGDG